METPRPVRAPIDVELSFKIVRIHAIDSSTGTVSLDFLLVSHWTDPRLVGLRAKDVDWDRAFRPKLTVQNDIDLEKTYENLRLTNTDGDVALTMRFRGSVVQNFDLHEFPFDTQFLKLVVRCGHTIHQARLHKHSTRKDTCEGFTVPEWGIGRMWAEVGDSDPNVSGTGRVYSSYVVHVALWRRSQYFVVNYALIVCLLGSSALVSFAMKASELADRCSVNLTLVLTLTALKLCVADSLPNISYQTFMDKYVLGATVFLFGVIAENAFVATIKDVQRQEEVDYVWFRLLAAGWVVINSALTMSALAKVQRQSRVAGTRGCLESPPGYQAAAGAKVA